MIEQGGLPDPHPQPHPETEPYFNRRLHGALAQIPAYGPGRKEGEKAFLDLAGELYPGIAPWKLFAVVNSGRPPGGESKDIGRQSVRREIGRVARDAGDRETLRIRTRIPDSRPANPSVVEPGLAVPDPEDLIGW